MTTVTSPHHPVLQEQPSAEVTFHLAPADATLPYRRVAGLTTADESWRDGNITAGTELEALPASLPQAFSEKIIAFAKRHIGPNATDQETDIFCHTFAEAVGHTAAESSTVPEAGKHYNGQRQAENILGLGAEIASGELAVGEHGAIGNPAAAAAGRVGLEHSVVGIGNGQAVQVDSPNLGPHSGLYIGRPEDYMKWLNAKKNYNAGDAPALFVHREATLQPPDMPQSRMRKIGAAARNFFAARKSASTPHEAPLFKDPSNPWS